MKKSINFKSQEWNDLIFKGRNKEYGAYEMRMSSSRRHIAGFVIVVVLTVLVAVIPTVLSKATEHKRERSEAIDMNMVLSQAEVPKEVEVKIDIPDMPVVPKEEVLNSIKFTPPIIGQDDEIDETTPVTLVDEVFADNRAVGYIDVTDGTDNINGNLLTEDHIIVEEPIKKKIITDFAEIMPQFPGGEKELMRFIKENLKYPVVDQEAGIQGRVVIRFVVTETGAIEDATVFRGVSQSCDREALRVVNKMPKWIPGRQNGKEVSVYFNLPVLYRLM